MPMSHCQHVLVVGAGIIGASIALHLLRAGARVTIIESGNSGGVATRNSFAWINANRGNPVDYFRLRVRAIEEWHELERSLPDLRVFWCGSLNWERSAEELQQFAAGHASWGYSIRQVGREEISAIEPLLAEPPDLAVHAPAEGAVDPFDAVTAILAAVTRLGGTVCVHNPARSLRARNGRICGVRTDAGDIAADETVVAAGAGAAALLSTAGFALPVRMMPSLLVVSRPYAKLLNGLIMPPAAQIRQNVHGRIIACADYKNDNGSAAASNAASALHRAVQDTFIAGRSLVLDRHIVGYRPLPEDGFPLVGRIGGRTGLYVAVTHSGITLAPVIGRLVAKEILTGKREPLLDPYGVDRSRAGTCWREL
jgi:glycine/D-amino acid oxidase-like deaminating enzyme